MRIYNPTFIALRRVFGFTRIEERIGANDDLEGVKSGKVGEERVGDSGGADAELRLRLDFRVAFLRAGRTGDDDSPPDWKMLLSSHPLSSVPGPNYRHDSQNLR